MDHASKLCIELKLIVLFEDPFWVGVFERLDNAGYSVARHVFGAEPTDVEVYQFILSQYINLRFSLPSVAAHVERQEVGYKRRQREARRLASMQGVSSKAHTAMQLQVEQNKKEKQITSKAEREADQERQFLLRQQHKKEKHRGH